MEVNIEDMEGNELKTLYNGLNNKFNEFKGHFDQIAVKMNVLQKELKVQSLQIQRLKDERSELLAELQTKNLEVDVLQNEISSLNEEREMMKTELREVRNENDILVSRLTKKDSVTQQAMEFAKSVLLTHNLNGIVNSLPAFSDQMVLTERPNSLNNFGSLVNGMDGMRLRPSESKEETYHSTRLASAQTSNDTYYDAIGSHRSSLTNGSTGVRPKVQQNQITSTVSSMPAPKAVTDVINESIITGMTESTNYYIDNNNNLRLKLVKVPIGRLMEVTMAYSTSPSDFWLHINQVQVNDFIHIIQVKQKELRNTPNSYLTAADIELGMYCAAIYSYDGYWYRAQVIDVTYDHPIERDSIKSVRVLFIDWGNAEERPLSHVMKLALELNDRRQAVNCYIQGCGHRSKWTQQAIQEFDDLLKGKKLKATFNKPHKMDELLDSVVYPIDLMYESDDSYVNLNDFLVIPDAEEEEAVLPTTTIEVADQSMHSKEKSADTVICNGRLNGHSNPNLSATPSKCESQHKNFDIKSKSNQNCAESGRRVPESTLRVPKSMPHLNGCPPTESKDILRIPPPIIPETTEGLIVEVSHLESPSYMYLHIRDAQVGSAQFDALEDRLKETYSEQNLSPASPEEVTEDSFWANRFSRDNRWYRCRVLELADDRALVNYVDWGNEEWVDINGLMPLTRQLANYPAMAVRCRLSNVVPSNESHKWSMEALDYFADLIADESRTPPLTAFIAQKPTDFDFESSLEVFLWTLDSNEEDVLVNLQLVVNKYATTNDIEWVKEAERGLREKTPPELMSEIIPIVNGVNFESIECLQSSTPVPPIVKENILTDEPFLSMNGCGAISKVPNGCLPNAKNSSKRVTILPELPDNYSDDDEWDPIADDAADDLNNYNIRPNDAGIATVGYRPDDKKICRYYGTTQGCKAKEYCRFLHVDQNKRFAYDDTEEEPIDLDDLELAVNSLVLLKVTTVVNPYLFYAVLPFGPIDLNETEITDDCPQDEELKGLSVLLKRKYSNPKNKENYNVFHAEGSLVAFRDERTDTYYRGRVLHNDLEDKLCTIFCIDLGIEMIVKRNQVFKLGNYFNQFRALAIQCSLTEIQPLSPDGWSQQSIDTFREWLCDKMVCAHIMYGKTEGKYYVDLISKIDDQEIRVSDELIRLKFAQSVETRPPPSSISDFDDEIYNSDVD